MPTIEIKAYQIGLYAGVLVNRARATITLFDAKQGTRAYLHFLDTPTLPPGDTGSNGNTPAGFYPTACYADVIDLLRNEKPVYLWLSGATDVGVTTAAEPVGDGEPSVFRPFQPIGA